MIDFIIGIIAGYLLGAIPFGLILTKISGLGDVRNIGSGGTGATNVLRLGGFKMALLTMLLDLAKAAVAVWLFGIWAGVAAVIGHNYPVWLKFKGGKGFAASGGFAIMVSPIFFGTCFAMWLIIALSFGYSSLAALIVLAIAPILAFAVSAEFGLAVIVLAIMGFWRHRENIKRLAAGTESKIKWRRNG